VIKDSRKALSDPGPRLELASRLDRETQGEVLFDAGSRGRYATDASIYQIIPLGVFIPRSEADVSAAIGIARELDVPVLARGAGTSQCGQTVGQALVIDNSKYLTKIVDIDAQRRTAVVEPGLVLDQLNARLKPHGLWFPVDVSTSAQATLGGMAGNNSSGSRSIAYGNMVHNVIGMSAWLADGELLDFGPERTLKGRALDIAKYAEAQAGACAKDIEARWPKVLRRVGGYNLDIFRNQSERPYTRDDSVNLAHLLIGSEGTLALTRQLTLQLSPLPRHKVLGIVNFPTFQQAMSAPEHIVKLSPSAVELVDRVMIDLSLDNPAFRDTIRTALIGAPAAILLVEFADDEEASVRSRLQDLTQLMGDLGLPGSVVQMVETKAQQNLWDVRKAGLNIMMSLRGDGKPVSFVEDCAVPLQHLAEYTEALTELFAKYGTHGTWYAHASVGTLHVRPILDMRADGPEGGAYKMRAIAQATAGLVKKFKGAYSGEHGDGICRGEWIQWQFGPQINQAFRAIKNHMDPAGLFNPGKIIDPPRMDDSSLFRFPPPSAPRRYQTFPLRPVLDWSAWNVRNDPVTGNLSPPGTGGDVTGGFAKAVEMCNNNGHCRKVDAGVMCPSYRVTRDERHSTRGRANTLRLALSGQMGADDLVSEEMHGTMDLCVSCKGCRSECPTGVDMAAMKLEFLAHYKNLQGFSMRDRLIGHLPDYAALASRFAALLNLRDKLPFTAWLSEKFLGFAAARALPVWRSETFWRAADEQLFSDADRTLQAGAANGKAAVFFVDTFNGIFESENALAAARVLKAAGYTLHTIRKEKGHFCCGRTYLSTGMLERAQGKLAELVEALQPFAARGIAIVGLEPSCLLTLRDEALKMNLGAAAEAVCSRATLLEEFIAREVRAGRFELEFAEINDRILVHGHCHQKAFGAIGAVLEVIRLIPGAKPELINSSCCGMAGSFGYEPKHLELSMKMAEMSLLPALRAKPDALVIADGTSCRHQIRDGAGRSAMHVARLLERQMRTPAPIHQA
jgi:FAD/FMN-containing dehydrogenase/Fe-S oxidoreductase